MRKDKDIPNTQYFEGVLQIRAKSMKIIEFVENCIEKDKKTAISKISKVTGGYDYYLTNQKYLRNISNKLKESFNGEVVFSKKLFTRNKLTQKEVYRVNALFREIPYKKGDIIEIREEKYEILLIGNDISLRNQKTKKRVRYKFKDFRREMRI